MESENLQIIKVGILLILLVSFFLAACAQPQVNFKKKKFQ